MNPTDKRRLAKRVKLDAMTITDQVFNKQPTCEEWQVM